MQAIFGTFVKTNLERHRTTSPFIISHWNWDLRSRWTATFNSAFRKIGSGDLYSRNGRHAKSETKSSGEKHWQQSTEMCSTHIGSLVKFGCLKSHAQIQMSRSSWKLISYPERTGLVTLQTPMHTIPLSDVSVHASHNVGLHTLRSPKMWRANDKGKDIHKNEAIFATATLGPSDKNEAGIGTEQLPSQFR